MEGNAQVTSAAKNAASSAIEHWQYVAPALTAPRSMHEYERLIAVLDEVLDAGGADESSHLAVFAERIGELIEAYEAEHPPLPDAEPAQVLRFLMGQHGLKQADLPEIGAQSVVSAILNGKRQLNLRQVSALSKRFGISAEVFIA